MEGYLFRTERLGMRPWQASDLDAFHRVFGDDRVIWWRDHERDLDASRVALGRAIEEQDQPRAGCGRFAVVLAQSGEVVGNVMLRRAFFADDIEVGYHLAHHAWGNGYATEGAHATLAHAFEGLALERVVAAVDVTNTRSLRVVEKLRMRCSGEAEFAGRLHRTFEVTRDEWLRRPRASSGS